MQTAVNAQAQVFAGTIADGAPTKVDSFQNAESTTSIPFGALVVAGSGERDALLVTSTGKPLGIAAHSHAYAKAHGDFPGDLDATGLLPGVEMNVLSEGEIWVTVCETVAAGDAVRVMHTADTDKPRGTFCKSADSGKSAVLSQAKFMTGGSQGGVARLWINALGATLTADSA